MDRKILQTVLDVCGIDNQARIQIESSLSLMVRDSYKHEKARSTARKITPDLRAEVLSSCQARASLGAIILSAARHCSLCRAQCWCAALRDGIGDTHGHPAPGPRAAQGTGPRRPRAPECVWPVRRSRQNSSSPLRKFLTSWPRSDFRRGEFQDPVFCGSGEILS